MASKLLLLLAAVGGARAFSSMPDKVPTRMTYSSNDDQNLRCIGSGGLLWPTDSSTWTDSWEDGCDGTRCMTPAAALSWTKGRQRRVRLRARQFRRSASAALGSSS